MVLVLVAEPHPDYPHINFIRIERWSCTRCGAMADGEPSYEFKGWVRFHLSPITDEVCASE